MDEHFSKVKPGDPISARRANEIAGVCERFGQASMGSFLNLHHGASTFSVSGKPPWQQFIMEVTDTKINDDDEDDSGLYKCKIRWYSNEDDEWKTDDDGEYELDAIELCPILVVGERVTAFWNGQRNIFIPCSPDLIRRFELKTALSPGSSAAAYLLLWDEDEEEEDYSIDTTEPDNPEIVFNIHEVLGIYSGWAKTESKDGSRGYAKWFPDSERWEVISMIAYGRCNAKLKGALDNGEGSCTVDNVVPTAGASPVSGAASELTAYNAMGYEGVDNANCKIEYNQDNDHWELYDVARTSIGTSVLTDFQVDGPNQKLQKKTRTVVGHSKDDESAWTDIHTGSVCP